MSLDAIRYTWPEILIRAKAALPPVAALLDGLQPQAFDAGRLVVALAPDVANQVAALTPDRLASLASAVEKETGLDVILVSLEFAEAGPGPAPAPPAPADAPSPDPEPAEKPEPDPPPKTRKAAKVRDPLADMEGEQIRYNLIIQTPPGMPQERMAPWWERRERREKMVRERRAARAKAEAEAAEVAPAENETLVQTDPGLLESAEGADE